MVQRLVTSATASSSSFAVLLAKQNTFDPIYHASWCLLQQYSAWVWKCRGSPSRLQTARVSLTDHIEGDT
eukprot:6497548-Pyramimonas_sp.AAC.1